MTTVAIAIPTYRRPEFLRRAVASALANERPGLAVRVIVVDNASPESPVEKLHAEFGNRVHVIVKDRNHGVVDNWSSCRDLAQASGADAWLMLEDDNYLAPGFLATAWPVLEAHPDVDLVFSACYEFDDTGRRTVWMPWSAEGGRLREGLVGPTEKLLWAFTCPIRVSALLVRNAPHLHGLPSYPEGNPGLLDVAGLGNLTRGARGAYYLPVPLMHYYINPQSMTATLTRDPALKVSELLRALRSNAEALHATGDFGPEDWRTVARHAPVDRLMTAVLATSLQPVSELADVRAALVKVLIARAHEIPGWKGPATRLLGRGVWRLAGWWARRAARRVRLDARSTDFDAKSE